MEEVIFAKVFRTSGIFHDLINHMAKRENINKSILYKEISITLIKANYKKYIRHIFKKLYDSSWLFVFVPFFMLIPSLISFLKYKSHLSLLVVFLSVFGLANHSTIYLFGRVQPRYLIYTDFILIFVLIIFTILFRNKNKKIILKLIDKNYIKKFFNCI